MKISRQVGTTNEVLNVFVQDATVSTGAGLANIVGSSVSFSWWHDSQASVSTGTASTAGAMGTYSTSAWVQVSSSNALGHYQFGPPNGVFAAGKTAMIHFYGAPSMAPLPLEIELTKTDNQTYTSSQTFSSTQVVASVTNASPANITQIQGQNAVTSAAGTLTVSTQALTNLAVNVNQILGQTPVTTSAGVLNVSTQTLTNLAVNVNQILGQTPVTSAAGVLNVSTQAIDKTGYGLSAAERASLAGVILTTTQSEGFRSVNNPGSMIQLQYEILANLTEFSHSGTTRTLNSVTSHTGGVATYQFDSSSSPSSLTRTA